MYHSEFCFELKHVSGAQLAWLRENMRGNWKVDPFNTVTIDHTRCQDVEYLLDRMTQYARAFGVTVTFEVAYRPDKPEPGQYGGAGFIVRPDRVEEIDTGDWVIERLQAVTA